MGGSSLTLGVSVIQSHGVNLDQNLPVLGLDNNTLPERHLVKTILRRRPLPIRLWQGRRDQSV